MFSNIFSLKWRHFLACFSSLDALAVYLLPLLHGFPESSAAGYLSHHGQVQGPGPKLDLNHSLYSMAQFENENDPGEAVTSLSLSDRASWSLQWGSGVPFPSLWSKQTHYRQPFMHWGSTQVPGLRTQPTAKLPWHLQWPYVHIERGEEERRARASALYLNHSREASGIGSCGLCLSSAPVVNQLGDQRRRWGKCQKALPHTTAWAATSSSLSDSRPERDKTPGPAPQETSWSKGDNHSTCQGLIWTTRTHTFRGMYKGWHTAGREPSYNAYSICWEEVSHMNS